MLVFSFHFFLVFRIRMEIIYQRIEQYNRFVSLTFGLTPCMSVPRFLQRCLLLIPSAISFTGIDIVDGIEGMPAFQWKDLPGTVGLVLSVDDGRIYRIIRSRQIGALIKRLFHQFCFLLSEYFENTISILNGLKCSGEIHFHLLRPRLSE